MNNDYIKEELNTLREYLRFSLLVLLAIVSGIITNFYQVISLEKPLHMLIFSVFAFPFFIVDLLVIKKLSSKIEDKLKELR